MLSDSIGGKGHLGSRCEIFYHVAALEALLSADCNHEWDFHFVGLTNLIADALSRKIDGDRNVFPSQALRELHGMRRCLLVDDSNHELRRRRVLRYEVVRLEKISR